MVLFSSQVALPDPLPDLKSKKCFDWPELSLLSHTSMSASKDNSHTSTVSPTAWNHTRNLHLRPQNSACQVKLIRLLILLGKEHNLRKCRRVSKGDNTLVYHFRTYCVLNSLKYRHPLCIYFSLHYCSFTMLLYLTVTVTAAIWFCLLSARVAVFV